MDISSSPVGALVGGAYHCLAWITVDSLVYGGWAELVISRVVHGLCWWGYRGCGWSGIIVVVLVVDGADIAWPTIYGLAVE